MSIPVELTDLATVLPRYGPGYLLSTDGTRVKAVHVAPVLSGGDLRVPRPGGGSLRNVGTGAPVTLVWPPRDDPGFSLIVDGTARADGPQGEDLVVTPTGAVLHKPVTADDDSAAHPFWISAFLDVDASAWATAPSYWAAVTGSTVSAPRGEHGEFVTLGPGDGHAYLKAQRVGDTVAPAAGPSGSGPRPGTRIHLDLHVPDVRRATTRAVGLGAALTHESEHGYAVLTSPGGLTFCLVDHPACLRPAPLTLDDAHRSLVDQVCVDVPPSRFDTEVAFWSTLTGWVPRPSDTAPEFVALTRPGGHPLRILLQRLDDEQPHVGAHLDLACSDRQAELARHLALGATHVADHRHCSVLTDPTGAPYCLTDRDPDTGVVPG